jgi:hypothetical protein
MLLSGRCEVFGADETGTLSFAVGDPEMELISVVGFPAKEAILDAVAANSNEAEILATPENSKHVAEALPDWAVSPAKLHVLGDKSRLPKISVNVRLLAPTEIEARTNLPPDLKEELAVACRYSPIAATIVEGKPVSFCYAGSQTESLWDVSIDTLAGYRNKGYAAACVAYMIELMSRQNKQPVWGAYETNEASLRLAAKLGFVAVDTIMVLQCKNQKPAQL